jgi:NTP pyrophosphatase (non-canonical NTP hydrolase)
MLKAIYLPKLNNLQPTLDSTLLKAMEEAGELARAVLNFLPYEHLAFDKNPCRQPADQLLTDVSEELLDVAQTCVTMIFVMEDYYGVQAESLIDVHLQKLEHKGYGFDHNVDYSITTNDSYKYMQLPKLDLADVTLLTTVCKIQEELGELTQYLGKGAGASGERRRLSRTEVLEGSALELLDIAQCCFTMMYILVEKYHVDINKLLINHVAKLQKKGYCA